MTTDEKIIMKKYNLTYNEVIQQRWFYENLYFYVFNLEKEIKRKFLNSIDEKDRFEYIETLITYIKDLIVEYNNRKSYFEERYN